MKAVVGLGNIGDKYKHTRHNVGFMFVDKLGKTPKEKNLILLKPKTMMNNSGQAVKKLANNYSLVPNDIYIVHDDLDLKLGQYKIQKGRGPKVHKGVNSIEESIKTADFWRVRIGVDNRKEQKREPGEAYVLKDFKEEEVKIVEGVIEKAIKDLKERLW